MNNAEFARLVRLCAEAVYHADGYSAECKVIEAVLVEANVPEFWQEPIRVMVQGAYYYGADEWMKQHAEYVPG